MATSFEQPLYSIEVNGNGAARLLEAIRSVGGKHLRFYQASSSEMLGNTGEIPLSEAAPFHPRSPYAAAKLLAHSLAVSYREVYGSFCACGILFTHDSPLRGRKFVTRRVTLGLAGVRHGRQDFITLGNLSAQRDWGFAGDYVDAMWRVLQQDRPDDYVIATGVATPLRAFVEMAARYHGYELEWSGAGIDETGIDRKSGRTIVRVDEAFHHRAGIDWRVGSSAKARTELGWQHQVDIAELSLMMAAEDDRRLRDGTSIL